MKFKTKRGDISLPSGEREAVAYLADMFRNHGNTPDGEVDWDDVHKYLSPKKLLDTVTTTEIRPLLSAAMETILREPVDPIEVISPLFTKISAKGLHTQVLTGAIGGQIFADDVPEGGKYPEAFFQIGNGFQVAQIGKCGLQASYSDEALRYSTWDIFNINLRMMYRAMSRFKERKAVGFFHSLGTALYDNLEPANSYYGVTTGRGLDMAANGTLVTDDLFQALAHMQEEGYPATLLLVNPLMFYQFVQDPVMRNIMMATGSGPYYNQWSGEVGPRDPWSNGAIGAMGPTLGNRIVPTGAASGETATGLAGREHGMTATFPMPGYSSQMIRVLASPDVPYDAETGLCDIYLVSEGNVGLLLQDEELTRVEWHDENNERATIRLRERYAFALSNEGMGVGVMKNVKCGRNYWDGTVKAMTQEVLAEIGRTDTVL